MNTIDKNKLIERLYLFCKSEESTKENHLGVMEVANQLYLSLPTDPLPETEMNAVSVLAEFTNKTIEEVNDTTPFYLHQGLVVKVMELYAQQAVAKKEEGINGLKKEMNYWKKEKNYWKSEFMKVTRYWYGKETPNMDEVEFTLTKERNAEQLKSQIK